MSKPTMECHGLDNENQVFFYEQDFYVLSNFSAFNIRWKGSLMFDTSEHVYHWEKFHWPGQGLDQFAIQSNIIHARSAHDAFKIAQNAKEFANPAWGEIKFDVMKSILQAKVDQHHYVKRKLLATGDRELIENSWRDDVWGWGPTKDGQNRLGKLWMEIRAELRATQ